MRLLLVAASIAVLAGCADGPAPAERQPEPEVDARPGALAPAETPPPRVASHDISFAGTTRGGVCIPVPLQGWCTGPGLPGEDTLLVEQRGASLFRVDLTVHWNATTHLGERLDAWAQPYRTCGDGCREGYEVQPIAAGGTSPLHLEGTVEAPEDAEGLWVHVSSDQALPLGGYLAGPQPFALQGTVDAVLR